MDDDEDDGDVECNLWVDDDAVYRMDVGLTLIAKRLRSFPIKLVHCSAPASFLVTRGWYPRGTNLVGGKHVNEVADFVVMNDNINEKRNIHRRTVLPILVLVFVVTAIGSRLT